MRRIALPLVLLALLGGLAIWWYQPVQVLKRRTSKLLHTLTLKPGTDPTGRKMGIYALSALLGPQVEFDAPPAFSHANGPIERSEAESIFSGLCDQAKHTRFEIGKFHSISITGDQADVTVSMRALIELPDSRPIDGTYECCFHWQLETDTWHLTRAKWAEVGD